MRDLSFATAMHILSALGYGGGQSFSSAELAKSVNTHPAFVRKILGKLKKAGLVEISMGRNGKSSLAKKPEKVSLYEVYQAVGAHTDLQPAERQPLPVCPISCHIDESLQPVFDRVEEAVARSLKKQKLSDVIARIP